MTREKLNPIVEDIITNQERTTNQVTVQDITQVIVEELTFGPPKDWLSLQHWEVLCLELGLLVVDWMEFKLENDFFTNFYDKSYKTFKTA